MKRNNKSCALCSKLYTYCPTCREYESLPRWMNMFDTENCKKIYFATSDYFTDHDAEKAKEILLTCDLSEVELYSERIQGEIKEIMNVSSAPIEVEVQVEEVADEVKSEEEDIESEQPVDLKQNRSRKRNAIKKSDD